MPRSMPRLQQTQRTRNARIVRGLGLREALPIHVLYDFHCILHLVNRRQRTSVSH